MTLPLMPKATAVWLVDNTALSFDQIAAFCGMHPLEIQGVADGDVSSSVRGQNPTANGQLTSEEITRCEKDSDAALEIAGSARQYISTKTKGSRYTPVARRQDKPDAISWMLKQYPALPDSKIIKLIGTTKKTIEAVRTKAHWNSSNIRPKDPVLLGLCTQTHLDAATAHLKPDEDQEATEAS